jgi:beta-glucosidase
VSSNIDDRTLHELYAWPFMDSLREGAGSIMCSYQRINNSYGCQNSKLMNGILKEELGFEGFVVCYTLKLVSTRTNSLGI